MAGRSALEIYGGAGLGPAFAVVSVAVLGSSTVAVSSGVQLARMAVRARTKHRSDRMVGTFLVS